MKQAKKTLVIAIVVVILMHGPIGGLGLQTLVSAGSYVGVCVGSIFNTTLRQDLQQIKYNPFNSDAAKVVSSQSVSFYQGVPYFRNNHLKRSGSFCAVLLARGETDADAVKHEFGHNVQQLILGPVTFLMVIGIPSALELSVRPYYDRPWEITADLFGDVASRTDTPANVVRGRAYLVTALLGGPWAYVFLPGEF
ncbi:MAG: hypothetical protein NC133_00480 [Prevotella sp.]|nr:hypothetical protein [Prevotella sp.]